MVTKIKKSVFILITLCMTFSCDFFIAGNYPYAEYYEFDMSREGLIEKIGKFKQEHPEYKLITRVESGELAEYVDRIGKTGMFYHIYFYIKKRDLTLHCIINMGSQIENTPVEIGLDAVSTGVNFASWKDVNTDDLTKEENAEIKNIFETEILDKLGTWQRY